MKEIVARGQKKKERMRMNGWKAGKGWKGIETRMAM
jgi:hypothetical protein